MLRHKVCNVEREKDKEKEACTYVHVHGAKLLMSNGQDFLPIINIIAIAICK